MSIFFQHVGEAGTKRDFPKTIGTRKDGLVRFILSDISDLIDGHTSAELDYLNADVSSSAEEGFQVWGIPSGAKSILRDFSKGDHLLLLESITPGGRFGYAGRAIGILKGEQFRLSEKLWGEARFPIIVLLDGEFTDFSWHQFCEEFGYKKNWNPAGNTYELKSDRIRQSRFTDEADVITAFLPHLTPKTTTYDQIDPATIDPVTFTAEEGGKLLQEHLSRERSAALISQFKRNLSHFRCEVCGFDFQETYGRIGKEFIEAHHIQPLGESQQPIQSSISDLVAVCSNCHRMLHREFPAVTVDELKKTISMRIMDRIEK